MTMIIRTLLIVNLTIFSALASAETKIVNLSVAYKTVNFTGKDVKAIAVNDQIPGPTLHFQEGDDVVINVRNNLPDQGTVIHWHGLLVPWQMDGVEHVTQPPIEPGKTFSYRFRLKQSGTYWYHSHSGFQEQQGVYGAIIIDPKMVTKKYDIDTPMILSDWIDTNPNKVYANLKKEGDFYSARFPLQPSLVKFMHAYSEATTTEQKKSVWNDYYGMQFMRMSIYDISDVAYQKLLLNGHTTDTPWQLTVKKGDLVRLRLIAAGASTFYRVKIPGMSLKVIHVEGNDVVPYTVPDLLIAPAETYDVELKIESNAPYIIYAEGFDKLNHIYGVLIPNSNIKPDIKSIPPFLDPKPISMDMSSMPGMDSSMSMGNMSKSKPTSMDGMAGMNMDMQSNTSSPKQPTESAASVQKDDNAHEQMDMSNMSDMDMSNMPEMKQASKKSKQESNSATASTTSMADMGSMDMGESAQITDPKNSSMNDKYTPIVSPAVSNDPNKPYTTVKLDLNGYMDRYIWFINGVPEYKSKPLVIEPGKRYRLIFTNNSMMHHPMHLHGHWFILRNGHGKYDPKLHTIDVAPMETIIVDVDADAGSGFWYFHCHNLFHMMAGMALVVEYPQHSTESITSVASAKFEKHMPLESNLNSAAGSNNFVDTTAMHMTAHPVSIFANTSLDFAAAVNQPNTYIGELKSVIGYDYNKLQFNVSDFDVDNGNIVNGNADFFYQHLISQFWWVKGGANYVYQPTLSTPYWQPGIGIEGLMPFFINTDLRAYYYQGALKFDLDLYRDTQITNNWFIRADARGLIATQSVPLAAINSGFNQIELSLRPYYRLSGNWSVYGQYTYSQSYGYAAQGVTQNGGDSTESLFLIGFSMLY